MVKSKKPKNTAQDVIFDFGSTPEQSMSAIDDLIVITDAGVLMRQPIEAIRTIGRVTQGVRLVKLDDGSIISSITRVMKEAEKKEEQKPKEQDETEDTKTKEEN